MSKILILLELEISDLYVFYFLVGLRVLRIREVVVRGMRKLKRCILENRNIKIFF